MSFRHSCLALAGRLVPVLAIAVGACFAASAEGGPDLRLPIVGGPCEGCEAVFQGLPDNPPAEARIAPLGEPGAPLRIFGTVVDADGSPVPGTIVYAYHTNANGIYPRDEHLRGTAAYRHGKLRGWATADESGRYRFDTIRPGGYPGTSIPQHIHMHVIEPGRCTYYIDDIVFEDDPRLTPERRKAYRHGRGGPGIVMPRREEDGVWIVERDIVLGEGVPGYEACSSVTSVLTDPAHFTSLRSSTTTE